MDINETLINELSLLREAIERIADSLESIDEKMDDLLITEEEYAELEELLSLNEDDLSDDYDEFDEDDEFEGDDEEEENKD